MPFGRGGGGGDADADAPCPRCARRSRVDFQVKPSARQSFVTRMCLTISCSSRKKKGYLGVTQEPWGTGGQRICTDLQQRSAAERKSSSTKESLSSPNTTLVSPRVISQMIDEDKPTDKWPALPVQPMISQPGAHHPKQSSANHGLVNIHRALMVLPSRLEIQVSLGDTTSPADWTDKKHCQKQQKGFAFITITARRVAAGSRAPKGGPGAVEEPKVVSLTSSKVPAGLHRWPPPPSHANQYVSPLKRSGSSSQLAQRRLFGPGKREKSTGLQSNDGGEKAAPSFTSCVHLGVSQQCPSTIYYLDKSLNVCLDQPPIKCQKIHRSTLSFKFNCSSARLTADGVDGIANGQPVEEMLQAKLLGETKAPHKPQLSADLRENNVFNKEKANKGSLGAKYSLQRVFVSELPAVVDIPRRPNEVVTTKKEDDKQPGSYHTAVSLQVLQSSDEAGTPVLSGRKKQQCTIGRSSTTPSDFLPDTASSKAIAAATAGSSKKRDPSKETSKSKEIPAQDVLQPKISVSSSVCNTPAPSRTLSEENVHRQNQLLKSATHKKNDELTLPEKTSPAPWTLQEALEIHNPQFISRSQERQKRLERMIQLRKAQQSEAPASNQGVLPLQKLSSTLTSSKRKQYTIPHPLSDNLFKPKERFIPEKEMHMRSKRIYDNLPEVKKKQEEKQKRIILQRNRLRVEMFKKQLLDQLLQRNTE